MPFQWSVLNSVLVHMHFRHDTRESCRARASLFWSQFITHSCIIASRTEPQKHCCVEKLFLCDSVTLFFRDTLLIKVNKIGPS